MAVASRVSSSARQAFIKQKGVQAVIFDMAGTVIDWGSSAPVEAFKVVFAEAGVDAREEEARAPMGLGKRDHIKAMLSQDRLAAAWSEAKGRPHTDEDIDELYEQFTPAQVKAARSHSDLIPGTVETLAAARAMGARIGACTGYNDVIMAAVMEQARERGFDPDAFMFCFNDNSNARPKPWMSTQLAAMMDASPLHTCVKVDDTTPGIYEGLNAGMWTVGVGMTGNASTFGTEAEFRAADAKALGEARAAAGAALGGAGAHYVIDGVWDLPAVLEDINARMAAGETPLGERE